jgi:hypothetical protein
LLFERRKGLVQQFVSEGSVVVHNFGSEDHLEDIKILERLD